MVISHYQWENRKASNEPLYATVIYVEISLTCCSTPMQGFWHTTSLHFLFQNHLVFLLLCPNLKHPLGAFCHFLTSTTYQMRLKRVNSRHVHPILDFHDIQYSHLVCSMYDIFTYVWMIFKAKVRKHSIHGAFGHVSSHVRHLLRQRLRFCL